MDDYEQLRNLLAGAAQALDDCDVARWTGFFTPTASFVTPLGSLDGQDALRTFIEGRISAPGPRGKHLQFNEILTVDGDVAAGATDFYVVARPERSAGRYTDRYVRTDGRWLIAARKVETLVVASTPPQETEERSS